MIKLPRQKWYTVEGLAEEWGCSVSRVVHLIETGKLSLRARFAHEKLNDEWLEGPAEDWKEDWATLNWNGYEHKGDFIRLEDVEHFEKTLCLDVGDKQEKIYPKSPAQETDEKMVMRLKEEGLDNEQIAQKLKDSFPRIVYSRIGRLITEEPGTSVTTDAYRKRGKRLLKAIPHQTNQLDNREQ